jgi:hypothetical protein
MAKTIDNTIKSRVMKRIALFLILVLVALSSQGQNTEKDRVLYTGKLEELEKVVPIVDSLLAYPGNSIELRGDRKLPLNTVVVVQERSLKYAVVSSLSVENVSYDILLNMYKMASYYAEVPAFRQKQLSAFILFDLHFILTEQFKHVKESAGNGTAKKEQLRQIVDLARKCQAAYYRCCFRYVVYVPAFNLYPAFADGELVELLRYSLNHPQRTEQEMSIAIQCHNDEMYYVDDTLRCGSLPNIHLCYELSELKRKSAKEKIPLDTLIEQHNREIKERALHVAKYEDFRKSVLQLLDENPIKGLEPEVVAYGKLYEQDGVDWLHTLARLGYKNYVNRYVASIDSRLKRDEHMKDQTKRFYNVLRLQNNLIRLGHPEAIAKFAPLLLSNDMMQGNRKQTSLSFQVFLMLRFYLPDLDRYGRTCFVPYSERNNLGKQYNDSFGTEGVPIALKPIRNAKHLIISYKEIYEFGDELDYRYYPNNFCQQMYDWMVKHKGKYKLRNTDKTYDPF